MNINLEGCLRTCFVEEVKENMWKMRQHKVGMEVGNDDMTKDWNHGLMIIRRS
jgi:hypothetical protein